MLNVLFFEGSSKFTGPVDLLKDNLGGSVSNETERPIRVTVWRKIVSLPPGKNTHDLGIFDTDSIMIDEPTTYEGTLYQNGLIRFCDFNHITITRNNGRLELQPSITNFVCQIFNEYNHFATLHEAFPFDVLPPDAPRQ